MATTRTTTPGATTVRVATQTGAAKDDLLSAASTGLSEDHVRADLNVLSNDPGAARLYSLFQDAASLPSGSQFPVVPSIQLASGAVVSINDDGTIGYDASAIQASLQSYAAGEEFNDNFVYTARMANGALSTASVSVKLAGVNDAPTLASIGPVTIDDTAVDDQPAPTQGQLIGNDVDHGAILTYRLAEGVDAANDYGTLTLDQVTGAYSFAVNAGTLNALAAGESETVNFDVVVTDEHGANATQAVRFNLMGANDTAKISGDATASVTEDTEASAAGTLLVSDRDHDQSAFAPIDGNQLAGTYGDFTFDNGSWTYSLHNDAANVQSLAAGDVVSDTLTVNSMDGSASKVVTVNINGTNDIAVITGTASGEVFEDGELTASGTLNVTDPDHDQSSFNTDGLVLGGNYGNFTFDADGNWTYRLNNDNGAVQALNDGQYLIDALFVSSLDGSAHETISVTVNGTNEPAPLVPSTPNAPTNPVTSFMVNHGLTDQNERQFFNGFDSNDRVVYSNNYQFVANSIQHIDADNNGTIDSTAEFLRNQGDHVTVVLVGYADLTTEQIVAA